MFILKLFCNDGKRKYWDCGSGVYETYAKALVACYENALDETQSLMADSTLHGWYEIVRNVEIPVPYKNDVPSDVTAFPVATVYYEKAPWERDFGGKIETITGYCIVEVAEVNKQN